MLLTLLRHGEVEGRPYVFRGRSDPPLTARGWQQLQRAATAFDLPPIDRLVSSTRRRCREFASAWANERGLALDATASLGEIDFGEWEELSPDEARAMDPQCHELLQTDPERWRSPGGESYREFRDRVLGTMRELRTQTAGHIGIVTHAGVLRVILSELLNIAAADAQRISIAPATMCRIWYEGDAAGRLLALHGELTS